MDDRQAESRVTRRRYRRAAERIMENSSLRDEMNDEQAQRVLDWGKEHLKKIVNETADLTDTDAENILEAQTERVSGIIKQVNQLTRAINNKDQQELADNYEALTRKLADIRKTSEDAELNVAKWLPTSDEKNNWVLTQLAEMEHGEEE